MTRRMIAAVGLDTLALFVAGTVCSALILGHPIPWVARPGSAVMLGAMAAGAGIGMFIAFRPQAGVGFRPSYGRAVSMAGVMLGVTAITLVFARAYWSRAFVLGTTVSWLTLNLAHRLVQRRRQWVEPIVLVTSEKTLIEDLMGTPTVEVIAVLDPLGRGPDGPFEPGSVLAVDLRSVLSDEMARFVSSSSLAGYPMRSLVSVYEDHTGRLPIVHLMEGWELTVPLSGHGSYVRGKQVLDSIAVLLVSPLALVLGLLISIAIAVDSKGPVIFKQRRIGREGRLFTLYKFRTMRADPDDVARFAAEGDDRLTRVGRFLRRIRIDELPQLWNVLRGDLSIVGPRPEQAAFSDRFGETIPFYSHRNLVRPGITGWAQVNFGYADDEADTIEKLSYDLYYVKHVSAWLDLEILGRSVWTVLSGFGAR